MVGDETREIRIGEQRPGNGETLYTILKNSCLVFGNHKALNGMRKKKKKKKNDMVRVVF